MIFEKKNVEEPPPPIQCNSAMLSTINRMQAITLQF